MHFGSLPGGPICDQAQPATSRIHQLETRPTCIRDRCPSDGLEANKRVCFPPLLPDREVLAEDPQGRVHHHNGGTVLAFPGLVSSSDGEPSGTSPATPKSRRSAKESTQSLPPTGGARALTINHLQSIREHHTATGVSNEASDLLLAGWSKGTNWIPFHVESKHS